MPQIGISGCPQTPLQRWPPFIKPPMLKTWIHPTMLDFKKGYNLCNIRNITFSKPSRPPLGGGGWVWVLLISSDWDDWMGQNSKPKKIPAPKFNPPKIPCHIKERKKALNDITWKIETLVLNTQKNSYLNQATQKNTCQNFSSLKNSSIIPITRNPEYPPPRAKAQYPHTNSPDSSSYGSKKKKIREFNKRSKYFLVADHFINSHIHFSWQCMEIVRRKLTLVTVRVNLLLGEG